MRRLVMKYVLSTIEFVTSFLINIPVVGFGINVCLSFLAGASRLFNGNTSSSNIDKCSRPTKMLILYQYEGCPFCRRVREQLSSLSLDVLIYPCPRVTLGEYGIAGNRSVNIHVLTHLRFFEHNPLFSLTLSQVDIDRKFKS